MARDKTTTFQRSWVAKGTDFSKYDEIYVAPVASEKTRMRNTKLSSRQLLKRSPKDAAITASFLEAEYQKAFMKSKRPWKVYNRPTRSEGALTLELNLVELAPARPELELAGKFVPGPGPAIFFSPSIAIEGRLKESRTGKVIARFADREKPPISPVDFSTLQYYRSHQLIMRAWAKQTVKWVERKGNEKIYERLPVQPIVF